MTAPIVTIAGAKGGVGKTTTSINLASAIAGPERTVAVIEMDLAMANFVDFLSIPSGAADPTLHDVLAGDAEPFDAVYPFGDHVAAVPSGTTLDGYARADMDEFPRVLKRYALKFDIVVVDTGAGLSRLVVDPIGLADGSVVVSTPRVAAVRDADKTVKLSKRVGTPVFGLVLTQSGTGASPGPERISEFLGVDLLGHVPDDEAVPNSQDQGVPVVTRSPESPAGSTYRDIADNVLFALSTHSDGSPVDEDFEAPDRVSDEGATAPAVDGGSATQLGDEEPADGDRPGPDDVEAGDEDSATDSPQESGDATGGSVARLADAPESDTASPSAEADESETEDGDDTDPGDQASGAEQADRDLDDATIPEFADDASGEASETAEADGTEPTETATADDRDGAGEEPTPVDEESEGSGPDDPDEADAESTAPVGPEPSPTGGTAETRRETADSGASERPASPERPGRSASPGTDPAGDRTDDARQTGSATVEDSADADGAADDSGPGTADDAVEEESAADESESETEKEGFVGRLRTFLS